MPTNHYPFFEQENRHPIVNQFRYPVPQEYFSRPEDDIEIIDLDGDRDDIKPTTWHIHGAKENCSQSRMRSGSVPTPIDVGRPY